MNSTDFAGRGRLSVVLPAALFAAVCLAGPSDASELYSYETDNIPSGVRATGLGGNLVALYETPEGLFYNPALAAVIPAPELALGHHLFLADSQLSQLALNIPAGITGFGITGKYFTTPPIQHLREYEDLGTYYNSALHLGGMAAIRAAAWSAFGVGVRYLHEEMATANNSMAVYDVGLLLRTPADIFAVGASADNISRAAGVRSGYTIGCALKVGIPKQMTRLLLFAGGRIDGETGAVSYSFGLEQWSSDVLGIRAAYVHDVRQIQSGAFDSVAVFRAGISLKIGGFGIDYGFSPIQPIGMANNIGMHVKIPHNAVKTVYEQQPIQLKAAPAAFSPNGDGVQDTVLFSHAISTPTSNVVSSTYTIYDAAGMAVVQMVSTEPVATPAPTLVYDGKDAFGAAVLPDGTYFVDLQFSDVTQPEKYLRRVVRFASPRIPFVIDTVSPRVSLTLSSTTLSPDGDGVGDRLEFVVSVEEEMTSLSSVTARLETMSRKAIRRFPVAITGNETRTVSRTVQWDGTDEVYGAVVPNGEYRIVVTALDAAGNKASAEDTVTVNVPPKVVEKVIEKVVEKTEVVVTTQTIVTTQTVVTERVRKQMIYIKNAKVSVDERGTVITYPTRDLFIKDTFDINPVYLDSLGDVAKLIREDFPENKIIIEGHTDSVGDDMVNRQKTESYAYAVYNHLTKVLNLDPKNLEARGMGESKPIGSNKTRLGRLKNQRLEIIIRR